MIFEKNDWIISCTSTPLSGWTLPWHPPEVLDTHLKSVLGRSSVPGLRMTTFLYLRKSPGSLDPSPKKGPKGMLLCRVDCGTALEILWDVPPRSTHTCGLGVFGMLIFYIRRNPVFHTLLSNMFYFLYLSPLLWIYQFFFFVMWVISAVKVLCSRSVSTDWQQS